MNPGETDSLTADTIDDRTEISEFEQERRASLRVFEVTLINMESVHVTAHFHDGGHNAGGHLSFVVVNPEGEHMVDRVFSVHVWAVLREVTPDADKLQLRNLRAKRSADQEIASRFDTLKTSVATKKVIH